MSADNKHKIYNAADIERYHRGLMDTSERHALEKAALDDPFLADALEGYAAADDVAADTLDLQNRLAKRLGEAEVIPIAAGKKESFRWMRVAAMIILLAGGAILASQFLFNKKESEIAKNNQPSADSGNAGEVISADTSGTEVTFGDSTSSYPMVVDEEPTSGGQPTVTNTKPVRTEQIGSTVPKSASNDLAAPVTIESKEDDGRTAPATQVTEKLADATDKNKDDLARMKAVNERKTPVNQARAAQKYQDQNETNIFRGKVTDENNRGLPFANVTNVRDNVGTYTDAAGNFVLTSPDTVVEVQVRSLGYDNNVQQLRRSAITNNVVMQDNVEGVTETIVSRNNSNAMRRQIDNNMKVEEPEPADGWENYDVYLANNLNTPTEFKPRPSAPQEVELSFEVNKQGEPVNIKVEKSLCKSCDQEAIRLVKEGPKWKRNAKKRTRLTVAF
jgi:hypothetical protein